MMTIILIQANYRHVEMLIVENRSASGTFTLQTRRRRNASEGYSMDGRGLLATVRVRY